MAIVQLQGTYEVQHSIVYEYDTSFPPIGIGGIGDVYAGVCRNLKTGMERKVAVKCLRQDLPQHIIEKARREVSIRIKSDNLLEMIAFVETESDSPQKGSNYYVVSELLHCVSLADVFKGRFNDFAGKEITFARKLYELQKTDATAFTVKVITQLLSGMMLLHDKGYIHRDIDPTNIVVTSDGHIKLIDYGICKHIGSIGSDETLVSGQPVHLATVQGTYIGKPEYSAPEQIDGLSDMQTYATDVYAVGILMYQCLTGRLPFSGNRYDIMQQQRNMKVRVPIKNIRDVRMRAIVRKACEKSQPKRYQSATEMRYAIECGKEPQNRLLYYITGIAMAVILGIVISMTILWQENAETSCENRYVEALEMIQSSDTETLRTGIQLMDSLARGGNIDAMYEMSRIYTSCKDPKVKICQHILGINPRSRESHLQALKWLNATIHQSDSTHAKSLYSLGWFYVIGTENLSKDYTKAHRLFEIAGREALKNNDEETATLALEKMHKCEALIKKSNSNSEK